MNEYVRIVAGGSGSRMNSDVPKQYMEANRVPIIVHTIKRFFEYSKSIQVICCVHANYSAYAEGLMQKYFPHTKIKIVLGGETRFNSVKNGLAVIKDVDSLVAVHDAARPLVSKETIERCFASAKEKNSGVPVIKVSESIRIVDGNNSRSINRDNYRIVQTPQCFKTEVLQKAFEVDYKNSFTDDATVFENAGHNVSLVEGNIENIKITLPSDILIAEALLKK
jgi:2-C-methyl-D-erythritol 4-phosphate cytidylyltransferase